MKKLIVSTWITLDGVFDATNMQDWFNPYDSESRQQYIRDGILAADAIIFGRRTYEMLAPYWSSLKNNEMGVANKLNKVQKYVVSTTLDKADWEHTTIIKENIAVTIQQLKQQAGTEIQVEGSGELVQYLLKEGLVDELRLLVHPVIAGKGKNFYNELNPFCTLELLRIETLEKGVVLLCYQPSNREK